MAISTFVDGGEITKRDTYQKSGVFVRTVNITTNRKSYKSVGYESESEAQTAADSFAAGAGNSDVRYQLGEGGLWTVTYTHVTVTRVYGQWYIPVTPS